MSSSSAGAAAAGKPGHGDGGGHGGGDDQHHHNPHLAHHFDDIETQNHASRLGMWLFLGTEVLLFAGLFLGYSVYRHLYHETFRFASHTLNLTLGTINTVVLISSSLTVALAHHAVAKGKNRLALGLLAFTIVCALAFLVIKGFEYNHKFEEGALPGKWFHFEEMAGMPGANMFFTVYFLATGLHAFHVIVGMGILIWVAKRLARGDFSPDYNLPVELGGLYWHLVDLVWIFLFPLLYLI
jgi:cytochrome c oxidase subunit 3